MRDKYAGDVSDLLKFAFLRALTEADRTLGIAWYYASGEDGRTDGKHLEWRTEPAWKRLDPQLHAALFRMPKRSVVALERAKIWPNGPLFHREPIPSLAQQRSAWGVGKRTKLERANLVFLDPDNGLGPETEKYATLAELSLLRRRGRAIAFITFPARKPHAILLRDLHDQLLGQARAKVVITLRTCVSVPLEYPARGLFEKRLALIPRVKAQLDISYCKKCSTN